MDTGTLNPNLIAAPHEVELSAKRLACISTTSQKFIDEKGLAGAVTVVARRGKIAYFEAFGTMDLEADKSMQRDTIFRIYSMTKPIAAAAVMMLCEAGKLHLDAPVSVYLPELGGLKVGADTDGELLTWVEADRDMTVCDLMRHTAGLPGAARYMAGQTPIDKRYREAGLHLLHECDLQEMVERLGRIPLLYQPGTKWHYSIAADVLGRLIEVTSGQPFDAFLAERIFQPLGMHDTGFYVPKEKIERFASMSGPKPEGGLQTIDAPEGGTGHISKNSFTQKPKFLSAGGGLVSTATDFARFCLMLSDKGVLEGERLMTSESVELMTRNHLPEHLIPLDKKPDERYAGLGFGLGVSVRVKQTNWIPASQIGEYGWIGGASTEFWISPRDELVVITLAQHIPFSELSQTLKPLIYAAISKE
ncbi:beta-lactamase family protein [Candidatus Poribacteria bacterium]|nr:beta-lactamase family protein [Candidatus Poribacteria bacterium]